MFGPRVLSKLQNKKYRKEYGCFLVEGKKGVLDAIQAQAVVQQLVVTTDFLRSQADFCQQSEIRQFFDTSLVLELPETEFVRLMDTTTPQGIAAVVQTPTTDLSTLIPGSVIAVLEDVRDPGNLGTMIRTADWFGVDGLLLIGGADPYQPKVVRSTMGSLFHVPLVISENIQTELETLRAHGFRIIVTRPEASEKSLQVKKDDKVCVIFGNEAAGTSDQIDALADEAFSIPKIGQAESLNVAVSFGILMYALL